MTNDSSDSAPLTPYHFSFADGIVEDYPMESHEDGHMMCAISVLRRPDGDFRGYISVYYPGDGFSAPLNAATIETFGTRPEALAAAKQRIPTALKHWDPMPFESTARVAFERYRMEEQLIIENYLKSDLKLR